MSNKSDKENAETAVGCVLMMWTMFVTTPMWLVLLFLILSALGDNIPVWGWVLYWTYIPSMILGLALAAITKQIKDS